MIPYASYFYFAIVGAVTAVSLSAMNLWRQSRWFWILSVSAVMLLVHYAAITPSPGSKISELS